jgi:hypothetical protein
MIAFAEKNKSVAEITKEEVNIIIAPLYRYIVNPEGICMIGDKICYANKENFIISKDDNMESITQYLKTGQIIEGIQISKIVSNVKKTRATMNGGQTQNTAFFNSPALGSCKTVATCDYYESYTYTAPGQKPDYGYFGRGFQADAFNYKKNWLGWWVSNSIKTEITGNGSAKWMTYSSWGWNMVTSHMVDASLLRQWVYTPWSAVGPNTSGDWGSVSPLIGVYYNPNTPTILGL